MIFNFSIVIAFHCWLFVWEVHHGRQHLCQEGLLCGNHSWWRPQMETFFVLLAISAGNSPVPREFPAQRPVTRSVDVSFDLCLNKRLSEQSWGWWFETLSRPLWRHCNVDTSFLYIHRTVTTEIPKAFSRTSVNRRWSKSKHPHRYHCNQSPNPTSDKTSYREISWNLVTARLHDSLNHCVALKFDKRMGSSAAEVSVKFQRNRTILNTNVTASGLHEILR